jgi:hypothetical protein
MSNETPTGDLARSKNLGHTELHSVLAMPGTLRQSLRVSSDGAERKRKTVRLIQRYVLNPSTMLAVRMGLVRGTF